MYFDWYGLLQASIALFVIIDPIGNLPIFMGITEGLSEKERLNQFNQAIVLALALLALFTVFGSLILNLFHISLRDFKIAGGVLLLAIAINLMLKGQHRPESAEDVGIMPLGCPLLVGPGAITTAMVLIGAFGLTVTSIAVAINFILAYFILYFGEVFYEHIGGQFLKAVSRVMVIIIAAIAVKFICDGIIELVLSFTVG
ncbi:MAG: MarC family protein [Candidatus Margulisiibacteriota bacterium]